MATPKKTERKDIVELVKLTLKQRPFTAWAFLAVVFVTFVATAITQIAGALKVFGWIK